MDHPDLPEDCRRLLALARRDPRRAARLARPPGTIPGLHQAWAAYSYGWVHLRSERLSTARQHLEAAQAIFASHDLALAVLHCRYGLLLAALLGGAGAELQTRWQALAADYQALGWPLAAAQARLEQAAHLNVLGQPNDTLALLNQLRPLFSQQGSPAELARITRVAAIALANLGQFATAIESLAEATGQFRALRLPLEVARCQIELAWIDQRREHIPQALNQLQGVLAVFQRFDLPLSQAFCWHHTSLNASRMGDYGQALSAAVRAHTAFVSAQRWDYAAHSDMELGTVAYYSGLFELALHAYQRAETRYTQLGLQRASLVSRRNQALALRALGQPAAALALLHELVAPWQALGDQLELAEVLSEQALALRSLGDAGALHSLTAAEALFAALGHTPALAECRLERGWMLLDQGAVALAAAQFNTARTMLAGRPQQVWRVVYGLGRCALAEGDQAAALAHYQAASTTVAQLRRRLASAYASGGIFAQAQQLYRDALGLAADLEDCQALLALAEAQRAVALQRQAALATWHPPGSRAAELAQARAALKPVTDLAQGEAGSALHYYTELLLHARYSAPTAASPGPLTLDLVLLTQQLQAAFPHGWTVLNYAFCADELLIVTIDAHGLALERVAFDQAARYELTQACLPTQRHRVYLDLLRLRDPRRLPWASLRALTDRLLPARVRARLHPDHRLLIVPDGQLHSLPWAALRLDDAWLCERAIVQIAPTLGLWQHLQARPAPGPDALLIGCSEFGERAAALPHVAEELDLVARRYPGRSERREAAQASRAALLALAEQGALQPYGLLHIASHAQLAPGQGLLAHIKLADDDLLLDDIGRLNLAGALVTLTACNGAAGDLLPGNELLSLGWALLAAGARDVLASVWPVYDRAALGLLAPLYDHLAAGADPPTALVLAQRALVQQAQLGLLPAAAASPLIWGSFCVQGAGTHPLT